MTKAQRAVEKANSVAALLASAPGETSDPLSPPALLHSPMCVAALAVWREYVPRLSRMNLLQPVDRHTFAMFCVYTAEFAEAHQDVVERGYSRPVPTVSGGTMDRINPSVDRRDTAQKIILDMAKRFGLTPLDRFALVREQAGSRGGLFDPAPSSPQPAAPAVAETSEPRPPASESVIGMMDHFDGTPPDRLQ